MVNQKFLAYSVTIRPKDGLTDKDIDLCMNVVRKQCIGWKFITEKTEAERHAHIACYLKAAQDYSQWKKKWKNALEPEWDKRGNGTMFNVAYKHKLMYNDDWVSKYMEKGDNTEVIETLMPENHMEYYMDIERKEKRVKVADEMMQRLEQLWMQYMGMNAQSDGKACADFLCDIMYNKRVYRCINDDRKRHQLAKGLSRYLNRVTHDDSYSEWS